MSYLMVIHVTTEFFYIWPLPRPTYTVYIFLEVKMFQTYQMQNFKKSIKLYIIIDVGIIKVLSSFESAKFINVISNTNIHR